MSAHTKTCEPSRPIKDVRHNLREKIVQQKFWARNKYVPVRRLELFTNRFLHWLPIIFTVASMFMVFTNFSNILAGTVVPYQVNNVNSNLYSKATSKPQNLTVETANSALIERISISTGGTQANGNSANPVITPDGRYVAFSSEATNLVSNDSNNTCYDRDTGTWFRNCEDVFVHDQVTEETTLVSVSSDGTQGNGHSFAPAISADGRFIAFISRATNLVEEDTNDTDDIFVHDRETGKTTRVSIASDGTEANGGSGGTGSSASIVISADGRYVWFPSFASNLAPGKARPDSYDLVYMHDRETGKTTQAAIGSDGSVATGASFSPSISADNRYLAFASQATNLVGTDSNGDKADVFVHDRITGQTSLVSIATDGTQRDAHSFPVRISSDGRYVVFNSDGNFVGFDRNGQYRGDVFLHDRDTGETSIVSVSSAGEQGNDSAGVWGASITADGNLVVFTSVATNLVADDNNSTSDIFLRNRSTGSTIRPVIGLNGDEPNGGSGWPSITPDGRSIVFVSAATNLVTDDTNGRFDVFVLDLNALASGSSISGQIVGSSDCVSGVSVSAGSNRSTTTDSNGNYSLVGLPPGTYTVTPSKSNCTYSPPSRTETVPPHATGLNFSGTLGADKRPVVLLPGFPGSKLYGVVPVLPACFGWEQMELWPNLSKLLSLDDIHLLRLRLKSDGISPENLCSPVVASDIWYKAGLSDIPGPFGADFYETLKKNLVDHQYQVTPCPYDWRRFLDGKTATGAIDTLSLTAVVNECVKAAQNGNPAQQVDIVAHSTGGLVARAYILSSEQNAAKVNTIVSLGTPYLGTVKPFLILRYGDTMNPILQVIASKAAMMAAAPNWPAIYQLLPSEQSGWRGKFWPYFQRMEPSQSEYTTYSTYTEMQDFLMTNYNSDLVRMGKNLHSGAMDDWRNDGLNVRYFIFVGTGVPTLNMVSERTVQRLGESAPHLDRSYSTALMGDGTVSIHSATLSFGELAGDATICTYGKVDHGGLTTDATVFDDLNRALSGLLPNATHCQSGEQLASVDVVKATEVVESQQLIIDGPATVHVWDTKLRHTGPTSDTMLTDQNVPLISYLADNYKTSVSLQSNTTYTVTIQARETYPLDVKLTKWILGETSIGTIAESVVFLAVPVTPNDKLTFVYQPLVTPPNHTLALDYHGDGTTDMIISPTSILDAQDSVDEVPPISEIDVEGQQDQAGHLTGDVLVSLSAIDDGSGLQRIEYSTDNGRTIHVYSEPFIVNAQDVSAIYVQSVDRAGNVEYPWAEYHFQQSPIHSTFLPSLFQ